MSNLLSRDAYVYKNCYTKVLKWTNVKNAWDWQSNSWLGKMHSYKDWRGLLWGISCPGFHFPIMVNSRAFRGIVTDTTSIALNSDAIASILAHLYPPSSYCITYSTVLTTPQELNFILKPLNRLFYTRLDFVEVTTKVKAYRNRKEKYTIEKERYTQLLRKFKGFVILFYACVTGDI